jgi:hypothetical protein
MQRYTLLLLFILPLGLAAQFPITAFSAAPANGLVNLSWTIGAGNTCEDLEVQHSTDSINYTTVYTYLGVCGNATFEQSYSWTHTQPVCGATNYYRLYTRTNGNMAATTTFPVCLGEAGYRITVLSGQQAVRLTLDLQKSRRWELELYDAQGKIIVKQTLTAAEQTVILPALPAGLVIFRLGTETGDVFTGNIVLL